MNTRVRVDIVEHTCTHTHVTFADDDDKIGLAMTRDVWRHLGEPHRIDVDLEPVG